VLPKSSSCPPRLQRRCPSECSFVSDATDWDFRSYCQAPHQATGGAVEEHLSHFSSTADDEVRLGALPAEQDIHQHSSYMHQQDMHHQDMHQQYFNSAAADEVRLGALPAEQDMLQRPPCMHRQSTHQQDMHQQSCDIDQGCYTEVLWSWPHIDRNLEAPLPLFCARLLASSVPCTAFVEVLQTLSLLAHVDLSLSLPEKLAQDSVLPLIAFAVKHFRQHFPNGIYIFHQARKCRLLHMAKNGAGAALGIDAWLHGLQTAHPYTHAVCLLTRSDGAENVYPAYVHLPWESPWMSQPFASASLELGFDCTVLCECDDRRGVMFSAGSFAEVAAALEPLPLQPVPITSQWVVAFVPDNSAAHPNDAACAAPCDTWSEWPPQPRMSFAEDPHFPSLCSADGGSFTTFSDLTTLSGLRATRGIPNLGNTCWLNASLQVPRLGEYGDRLP
jgi:hypothetical protein